MNRNILQKILTELGKDKPSIDYLKGMVETLLEVNVNENYVNSSPNSVSTPFVSSTTTVSETYTDEIPPHLRAGPIGNIG